MNQQDVEVCKTLGRINRFSFTHGGALPAGSIAGTQFARCVTLVVEIGPDDTAPGTSASTATAAMDHLFDKVWKWGQCANLDKIPLSPTVPACRAVCESNFPVPFTTSWRVATGAKRFSMTTMIAGFSSPPSPRPAR
jgi:hypothetical protein